MKHRIAGYKLKRTSNERQRLFRQLIASLVTYDRLRTTKAKASAIQNIAEELVTRAKVNTPQATAMISRYISNPKLRLRFQKEIVPKLASRAGGYTQLISTGIRLSDHTRLALLQWTYGQQDVAEVKTEEQSKTSPNPREKLKQGAKTQRKSTELKKGKND